MNLCEKYRPRFLDDIRGQTEVVAQLKGYVEDPEPQAFLFAGGSGVGKTATAYCLAHELGCSLEHSEMGGVFEIPSGSQDADSVRSILKSLRMRPMFGNGWRVLIVNEADRMSRAVETIWLDALEHLPGKSAVVFTTNEPERLSQRFRQRCEEHHFWDDTQELAPAVQEMVEHVWHEETGETDYPVSPDDWMPTVGVWNVSFRHALKQVQKALRRRKAAV